MQVRVNLLCKRGLTSFGYGQHFAWFSTHVELTRTANLKAFRIGHHLYPMGDPAYRAGNDKTLP